MEQKNLIRKLLIEFKLSSEKINEIINKPYNEECLDTKALLKFRAELVSNGIKIRELDEYCNKIPKATGELGSRNRGIHFTSLSK